MSKPLSTLKPLARRNQRACQLCHITKVRCNATTPGSPCQNCYQRGVECVPNRSSRQKQRVQVKTAGLPVTGPIAAWSPGSVPSSVYPDPQQQAGGWNEGFQFNVSPIDTEWRDSSLSPTPPQPGFFDPLQLIPQPEEEVWNAFTNLGSPESSPEASNQGALLPTFIQPLPMMMNPSSIEFLYVNGAFALPSTQLQNALLQTFVDCVLPAMPIIDWPAFINAICNRESDQGSVSLLLFYAMLTAATTFVDIGHLQEAGYSSRQEAQEAFYYKAKLLYQAEYEPNTMTIIQSLLFMTYRLETADTEDSRYWISIAISTALSIGLFRDIAGVKNIRLNSKFWKRLAWSCYTTDSQIALRLRCRPIIQSSVFCHAMLTEEDFDIYTLSPESLINTFGYPLSHPVSVQRDLATMCISTAQLSLSINEVLDLQRSRQGSAYSPDMNMNMNTNMNMAEHSTRVSTTESALASWASSFPSSAQTYSFESDTTENPIIALQRNLLHMQFYTTLAVFYQSQPLPSSTFCVQYAAQQITRIAEDLYNNKLHRRLPIVGVTAILVALIIHISEMKKGENERSVAVADFRRGMCVMADLRDVYKEADGISASAGRILEGVNLNLNGGMGLRPVADVPVMSLPQVM